MLLLSAIILFDWGRPNIVHKDAIRLEQESYFYLLRRYLESVVGSCQARSMFLQLIGKVSELHILNEKHVRVYMDVNPKEIEPLLIEIFDLKNRWWPTRFETEELTFGWSTRFLPSILQIFAKIPFSKFHIPKFQIVTSSYIFLFLLTYYVSVVFLLLLS